MVLPCTTSPPEDLSLAKSKLYWQIGRKIVHFFRKGKDSLDNQHEDFHGRTSLFLDQMKHGNLSLKLSNVQLEDNAEYSCIYKPSEDHETKESKIKLNVSGKVLFSSEGVSRGHHFLLISHIWSLTGITSIFKAIFPFVTFCSLLLLEECVRKERKTYLLCFSPSGLLKARHLPLCPPFTGDINE